VEILIVEDHPLQYQLVRALLVADGYAVSHAATGNAAMALALDRRPDLILLDASLPGMSGFEVACELKRDARTRRIPIGAGGRLGLRGLLHQADRHANFRRRGRPADRPRRPAGRRVSPNAAAG
jgi:chemotaxis response regulator CheB